MVSFGTDEYGISIQHQRYDVWTSATSPGDDDDETSIQGRAYGSDGLPVGNQFQINSIIESFQPSPAIAHGCSGEYMATWVVGSRGYARGLADSIYADGFEGG